MVDRLNWLGALPRGPTCLTGLISSETSALVEAAP